MCAVVQAEELAQLRKTQQFLMAFAKSSQTVNSQESAEQSLIAVRSLGVVSCDQVNTIIECMLALYTFTAHYVDCGTRWLYIDIVQ